MTFDELEELERREKMHDPREERRLLPVDSYSQLDTGYTGRSDCDVKAQHERVKEALSPRQCNAMNPVPLDYKGSFQYACCMLTDGHRGPHKAAALYGLKDWTA